jgi:hypothetical protein
MTKPIIIINLMALSILSLVAQGQQFYFKPQLNFEFSLTKTIRQDHLPYAKINNNHRQAVILPGFRLEYIKSNLNGYFFNFGVLPLGYSAKYTDYAYIDPFYRQRATNLNYTAIYSTSESSDIWAFDFGFINCLKKIKLAQKKDLDVKFAYGVTLALFRPYSPYGNLISTNKNSMDKLWELRVSEFPYFNIDKDKLAFMVPLKLNLNIRSKVKNKELISFDLSYWHSFTKGEIFNLAYHNLTDNQIHENIVESKGTTWQFGVQLPIRMKLKK